jgi:hypothetical protein
LRLGATITGTSNTGRIQFSRSFPKVQYISPFVSRLPPATIVWQKTNQPIIFIASSLLFSNYCLVNSLYLFNQRRCFSRSQRQIKDILMSSGFSESQMFPHHFDFYGPDAKLDILCALLAAGLYPNICIHDSKRLVVTTGMTKALICKSSVNCPSAFAGKPEGSMFPYPYFVFGEKVRSRAVTCQQMTMVSPLHLVMFGSQKVDFCPAAPSTEIGEGEQEALVKLDSWIPLKMDPQDAALICGLRQAVESVIVTFTQDPNCLSHEDPNEDGFSKTVQMVRSAVHDVCRLSSGRYNLPDLDFNSSQRYVLRGHPCCLFDNFGTYRVCLTVLDVDTISGFLSSIGYSLAG